MNTMLITFNSYKRIIKEAVLEKLELEYLMEATRRVADSSKDDIYSIEIKVIEKNAVLCYTQRIERKNLNYEVEKLYKKVIEDEDSHKLENAIELGFQDLTGWELVNAFKSGNDNYLMTFSLNDEQVQFEVKLLEGDFYKHYVVHNENDRDFCYSGGKEHFNNPMENDSMYEISQIIKGKVLEVKKSIIVTEKGEIGWYTQFMRHRIHMNKREEITPCHLEENLTLKAEGYSRMSAWHKSISETRHYCLDVLSRKTPSQSYLDTHKFGLQIQLIDERDDSKAVVMWNFGEYDYNKLSSVERPFLEDVNKIIFILNKYKRANETLAFNYGKINEFIKHFEKELEEFNSMKPTEDGDVIVNGITYGSL